MVMKINPSSHWAPTNVELEFWDRATEQGVVRGKPVVVVKDLSTEKQLLTTNRKTLSVLNLFFSFSDRLIWVDQQRIRRSIQTIEDEDKEIRSHIPYHMKNSPVQDAEVSQAVSIGSE
jgi:hypothetical protein